MAKKKNKQSASQFPKIYRFITERKLWVKIKKSSFSLSNQSKLTKIKWIFSIVFLFLTTIILISAILFFTVNLYDNLVVFNKVNSERQQIQSQINFWKSIANKYDGYKDAYFKIALLEYKLGNIKSSQEYNKKALLLDPNFEDAKKLDVLLNK